MVLLRRAWAYWRNEPVRTTLEVIVFPVLAFVAITLLAAGTYFCWQMWLLLAGEW